jgi:hypothetical protein
MRRKTRRRDRKEVERRSEMNLMEGHEERVKKHKEETCTEETHR